MSDKMIRLKSVKKISVIRLRRTSLSDTTPKELKKLPESAESRRKYESDLRLLDTLGGTLLDGTNLTASEIESFPMEGLRTVAMLRILPFIAGNKSLLKWWHDAPSDEVDEAIAKVQRAAAGNGNTSVSVFAQVKAFADEVATLSGVLPIKEKRLRRVDETTARGYRVFLKTGDMELAIDEMVGSEKMSPTLRQVKRRNAKRRLKEHIRRINEV